MTTDAQVKKFMDELQKHGQLGIASARAGMDRKTGAKYRDVGKLPSELKEPRTWRTREDPLEGVWDEAVTMLEDAPELEAKALFEHLAEKHPAQLQEKHLRTFQRRVRQWRARSGPAKEVFFPQRHQPGEAMQTDWTWGTELGVTIGGEPFAHLLCHPVLPFSNWEWVTVCQSESMASLRRGVQAAVFKLGRTPEWHQTDQSSAATHNRGHGRRGFNKEYEALMGHLGMKPRTIGVGKKEQNGDVESANGAFKRRVKQHLLLRGSSDFASVDEYERWLQSIAERANTLRQEKLQEELSAMKTLSVARMPEWTEVTVPVSFWSTINVKKNVYSVPSRLIGETLRVRIYDDRLEVYHGNVHQLTVPRLLGESCHRINYRHIIDSLVRKPGALARYMYRDDLFPTVTFRRAYDRLHERCSGRVAGINYLRILHLAAQTMEAEVELALQLLLVEDVVPTADGVRSLVGRASTSEVPDLASYDVDLGVYDELLLDVQEVRA